MKITVLGCGMVGQSIAGKLDDLDHDVIMGTRNAEDTLQRTDPNQMTGISFSEWHSNHPDVSVRNYEESADEAELVINATSGSGSIPALNTVGAEKLGGLTLIDIANPLDFSQGMPPSLSVCNTDSLGEQIQREFPNINVVKSLNTMNAMLMVDPTLVPGNHNVFMSGNDAGAKSQVVELLQSFGWKNSNILDLGDISTARGTEMLLPVWLRLWGALGTPEFNFNIVTKKS